MHSTEDELIETIVASPALPRVVEHLQTVLNEERRRREQFRRDVDDSVKAEFINGEVITHSPASARHGKCVRRLVTILDLYRRATGAGEVWFEKAMIGLERNDYEPDVIFYLEPRASEIGLDTNIFPVPDFVVEVLSQSTTKRDRGIKFTDYAGAGIREYWIVDPVGESVEQFLLDDGDYVLKAKVDDGVLHSPILPGFHVPVASLFNDDAHDGFMLNPSWTRGRGVGRRQAAATDAPFDSIVGTSSVVT